MSQLRCKFLPECTCKSALLEVLRAIEVDFYLLPPESRWLPDGYEDDDVQAGLKSLPLAAPIMIVDCEPIHSGNVKARPTERRFQAF